MTTTQRKLASPPLTARRHCSECGRWAFTWTPDPDGTPGTVRPTFRAGTTAIRPNPDRRRSGYVCDACYG